MVSNLLVSTYECLQRMRIPNTYVSSADILNDFGILFLCQIGSLVYVSEISLQDFTMLLLYLFV